jgi:hypothetical protein
VKLSDLFGCLIYFLIGAMSFWNPYLALKDHSNATSLFFMLFLPWVVYTCHSLLLFTNPSMSKLISVSMLLGIWVLGGCISTIFQYSPRCGTYAPIFELLRFHPYVTLIVSAQTGIFPSVIVASILLLYTTKSL